MKRKIFFWGLLALVFAGCTGEHDKDHDGESEKIKIQLTAYSNDIEVFAEADPFVKGKMSNVLSHLSFLNDFKPVVTGGVKMRLVVGGIEVSQFLEKPSRKGIYSFDITPKVQGRGQIIYDIVTNQQQYQVIISDISIYSDEKAVDSAAATWINSRTNTVVFTKEQSWKIDFATELPVIQPFGRIIKTTAKIQPSQGDEVILSAKTNGLVMYASLNILEGQEVKAGQSLFTLSGSGLADGNAEVRFSEARNNFEKTKADFDRQAELVKDKIVSEKEFSKSKNDYENAKTVYDNLSKNFSSTGQTVTSPLTAFIKQLFVQNGQYVETGQPLISVAQNKVLLLRADVQQKYVSSLASIVSANIRTLQDNKTYTLEELNGKVLSYGRNTNDDNYLIPVNLQIDNKGSFVAGSFVELFLKTQSSSDALTIPNSSIMEEQGNHFVFIQIHPELFEKREVKIGVTDGLKTEIRQGINQNERIVSNGAIMVKLSQATGTLAAHAGHVH